MHQERVGARIPPGDHDPDARPGGSGSVLVVEDNSSVAAFLREALEEAYTVNCAEDAASGIALLDRYHPNVVLADCLLPGRAVEDLVTHATSAGTAVVMMSGDIEFLEHYERKGYRCLAKPFGLKVLLRTIGEACARQVANDPRVAARTTSPTRSVRLR